MQTLTPHPELEPDEWLERHGDALFRYALLCVGRRDAAEDLVQETLLAAWRGRDNFRGTAAERTWLIGILKHKVDDHFRRAGREPTTVDVEAIEEALFDASGHWDTKPSQWADDPAAQLEAERFLEVLQRCLALLPENQRASFVLREMEDVDLDGICKVLAVSATNLYVLLHRARLRVRQCLETQWFNAGTNR